MPPKARMPAPIDRPLSRAYLRKFAGWSTAFPPGVSDPTSLRLMENVMVNRDGSVRVRPGLRSLTREFVQHPVDFPQPRIVGTHETFYLADGTKAYLFAAREDNFPGRVLFHVGKVLPNGQLQVLDLLTAGFNLDLWTAGSDPSFTAGTTYVKYLQINNRILALSDNGEPLIVFTVGAEKKVLRYGDITMPYDVQNGPKPQIYVPMPDWINGSISQDVYPPVQSGEGDGSLLNYAGGAYNIAAVFTFSTELGETGPSAMSAHRMNRALGSWRQEQTDGSVGFTRPQGTPQPNPLQSADQLVFKWNGTNAVWNAAVAAGATAFNLYLMTWSIQAPVPVELELYNSRPITPGMTADKAFVRLLPGMSAQGPTLPIPTDTNRIDSDAPARVAQGLVASDRMVLVNDPTEQAVIRWTGNQPGNYLSASASRGGGRKTLTSGNMQVPACVKLWQNPQSADTLTVLCMGDDGQSTSYYMAPGTVTSQSDNTTIMSFEETTATPGTTSPFGCEVANNALYHPLDDQLMKSTASNYNINHKSMTDQIANMWTGLADKKMIVSSQHDQRLYFLVHNPRGESLQQECKGNEVWVLDLSSEGGTWSRWRVQGCSLRKITVNGRLYMSLVRPDGIYIFDPEKITDDYVGETGGVLGIQEKAIEWKLETNTQGANRAHDAWAHLKQANVVVGNFQGKMRIGLRGIDLHGRKINISKVLHSQQTPAGDAMPYDLEDYFMVDKAMKEWFFYAESLLENGVMQPSGGQLNLVQYRYAPISVNVGYEYGSVETFEYGRGITSPSGEMYTNGSPQPMIDTQVP